MRDFSYACSVRPETERARALLDRFFAGIGQGLNAYTVARPRIAEVERLNEKTDAELADIGLARAEIPELVFRDLLNV